MLKKPAEGEKKERILAELRRDRELRQAGYRERALKLMPHVCGRCGREFSGPRLRELTVHHRDHNYKNNPPDGSNWELLCLYCHDDEHEKSLKKGYAVGARPDEAPVAPSVFKPFEALDALLKPKDDAPGNG